MKQKLVLSLMLSLALVSAAPLTTAAPPAADDSITREQARAQAIAHSKTIQKLLLSVDSAQLDEKIQSYTLLPSITASTAASVAVPSSTLLDMLGVSASLTVTQTVYDGGTSALLSAIDAIATSIARQSARAEYFSVLSSADTAFYGVLEAEAEVEAAQADLDDAQAYEALAKAKLAVGIIASSDYLKAESESAAKQTALVQAHSALSVAQRTLASLTGASLPLKLTAIDWGTYDALIQRFAGLTDAQIETFIENVLAAAMKNNPTLSQSSLASTQAKSEVDLAKAAYLPSISASWTSGLSFASSSGNGSSALSVTASLPLDMWNTQATVDSKSIASRQAALDLDETQRTLDLDIQSAVFDGIASARSVSSSQRALDYAQSQYQLVVEQYKLSAASATDLSDAELLVSTNRTALITAQFQFLSNITSLRTYAGFETEDLLVAIMP